MVNSSCRTCLGYCRRCGADNTAEIESEIDAIKIALNLLSNDNLASWLIGCIESLQFRLKKLEDNQEMMRRDVCESQFDGGENYEKTN